MGNKEFASVKVEHALGSTDDDNPSVVYPLNMGVVISDSVVESSLEERHAYIVGVDIALEDFNGVVIAKVVRNEHMNNADGTMPEKEILIVAPEDIVYTKQQLEEMVYFNEQYYDSTLVMIQDEEWDAYDISEHKLSMKVMRSMAKDLPDGVFHIVVNTYLVTSTGNILVTQRSKNKTYPLKWEVSGGSILAGESPQDGARREVKEETGIQLSVKDLEPLYSFAEPSKHVIYHSFIGSVKGEPDVTLQAGETMDYMYLGFEEFLDLVESDRFVYSEQKRFRKNKDMIIEKLKKKIEMLSDK